MTSLDPMSVAATLLKIPSAIVSLKTLISEIKDRDTRARAEEELNWSG